MTSRLHSLYWQYAPARNYSEPAPAAPAAVYGGGNPFAAAAAVPTPVATPTAALATTADVSAGSFAGVSEADQIDAIRRLYTVVNPDKMGQVELMWQKFGAGIWEALAKRYPDIDMNSVSALGGSHCVNPLLAYPCL